jgi:hypothetical protein
MTPSIIPNWDSIPQNQPSPKDAVSKMDGAATSMGGMAGVSGCVLFARLMESAFGFDVSLVWAANVWAKPDKNDSIPNNNKHRMIFVPPIFSILVILSSGLSISQNNRVQFNLY